MELKVENKMWRKGTAENPYDKKTERTLRWTDTRQGREIGKKKG